ncbi:Uncharacterized conserved protein, DUF4415 family [Novosphingobium sp. CF614]|uniref:BrnA antitoxin family protein n=1 Tax=Novosphingobium sp. CF614 TaxID=1884364 RepID=UPI0008DFE74F|nr:BrnA antitoxin family protein [Novosphingobium sp. CF614]SFG17402.1 Uncharacterized conserved protein, DUF4415 family [Novosphingobium sp. CF614]
MGGERPIVFDDDNPEWTEEDFARALPIEEAPEILRAAFAQPRGRPKGSTKAAAKQSISLRLDPDVLAYFRATGPGWQSRINEVLRKAMA